MAEENVPQSAWLPRDAKDGPSEFYKTQTDSHRGVVSMDYSNIDYSKLQNTLDVRSLKYCI